MRVNHFAALVATVLVLVVPLARAAGPAAADPKAATPAAIDCPPARPPAGPADDATGLREAADSGFLWKATRDGRTAWLYGTIHVAQPAWRYPGPHVLAAIQASDTVALELDTSDPDTLARLGRAVMRKPGAPALPAALAARLDAQARAQCLDPAALAALRPEMQAILVELMGGRRLGLWQDYAVDIYLTQLARKLGKTVRALETPELQAALLVSDDPAETRRLVGDVLDEIEQGRSIDILSRMATDWRLGKLDDLAAYDDWCDCMTTPQQRADMARLIDARNPVMAAHIAQWHAEGHALFVAVGSLHMTGPAGLPALLRAKGFDVQRVDFQAPLAAAK